MWIFWHAGFPGFVMVALLARAAGTRADQRAADTLVDTRADRRAGCRRRVLCLFALNVSLPPAFHPPGDAAVLPVNAVALIVWLLNALALVTVLATGRLRTTLDLGSPSRCSPASPIRR